jgi:Fe-S-cluster containining protein
LRARRLCFQPIAELLVARGVIRLHELEERKQAVAAYFDEQEAHPTVHLAATADKHAADVVTSVDCTVRMPICHAICCKLWFALSVQDLEERVVHWNYAQPYGIAQAEDGRCVHQDRDGTRRCLIYDNRPLICRTYSCREDKRIWLDFENRVINPAIMAEDWPQGIATVPTPP